MKKLLSSVCLLFLVCLLHAQSHFQMGKVLPEKGDTLTGWIDYGNWRVNPRKIRFRSGPDGNPVVAYGLEDIRYFEITGQDSYQKAIVQKDMRPVSTGEISGTTHDTTAMDTVFLRILVSGKKISLYQLVDAKDHYYISSSAGEYTELLYKRYLIDDQSRMDEVDGYKNQLSAFLPEEGNKSLANTIDRATYTEGVLTRVVLALNGGQGQAQAAASAGHAGGVKVMAYGSIAAQYLGLNFTGTGGVTVGMNFNHPVSPSLYAGVDFQRIRNRGDLSLRVEVGYWSASFAGSKAAYEETDSYKLKIHTISPTLAAFYSFYREKRLRLYIGPGVVCNVSSYPTHTFTVQSMYSNYSDNNEVTFESTWLQFQLRVGAKLFDRLSLEVVGCLPAAATSYVQFTGSISNYSFRASYYF